jgi:1-deoxy-D-xylulose 5-phosphate reductoisomerase
VFARPWIKWASRYKSLLTILTTADSPTDFVANADNGSNDLHISSSSPSPSALSSTVKTDQDEIAVAAFLRDEIGFLAMSDLIENCMKKVSFVRIPTLEDYIETDKETRRLALEFV